MKVEFLTNQLQDDGRQVYITASELKKAQKDDLEFENFVFTTSCLFAFYGFPNTFLNRDEYEEILASLSQNKGDAISITALVEGFERRLVIVVYIMSQKHELTNISFS